MRVQGLGLWARSKFTVYGLGFRVEGLGSGVEGLRFGVEGLEFGEQGTSDLGSHSGGVAKGLP